MSPVRVFNPEATGPVLLVCEHASAYIPEQYGHLGLADKDRLSHAVWDPGALETAEILAKELNAVLVNATHSRLLYDCNRAPDAVGAIPEKSEIFDIPGNTDLSNVEIHNRIEQYYTPFYDQVQRSREALGGSAVIVTIHSFTPVYHGEKRDVELGILHDEDARLADAILQSMDPENKLVVRRNEPYDASDGVTHTLKVHGVEPGLLNVMIEIRNDLVTTGEECREMAVMLNALIRKALDKCGVTMTEKGK
ncbi:MAG: N-formylglutamate amidohydrolase [Sneathiellales bacterium]|nr:N-formylglutamate amidohydrolase [Sneathiellales bacterium]